MKKRDSKRRWKARLRLGKWVPEWAIVEWSLQGLYEIDYRRRLVRSPLCVEPINQDALIAAMSRRLQLADMVTNSNKLLMRLKERESQ